MASLLLPLAGSAADHDYGAQFLMRLQQSAPTVSASIRIVQPDPRLKVLQLKMPEARFSDVTGAGAITRTGDLVTWRVPPRGGELRYSVVVSHERSPKGYDAWVGARWALLRAEDVFPAAQATLRRGARSQGELLIDLPPGWSAQAPYAADAANRRRITSRGRGFERPLGWILAGDIGSRMDVIGDTTVRIAAPADRPAPRVPALALLRWTLPILQAELAGLPSYLLITMAGEPMWPGGLSAPNSFFLHADRPLISENATSPLLHELLHVMAPVPAAPDHDWIDEGLAEYLGLVLLVRSGTISRERFEHAIAVFRRRGTGIRGLDTRNASGAVTARAVALFSDIDAELQDQSNGQRDVFDLLRELQEESDGVDLARLRDLATALNGKPLRALAAGRLPPGR